jgi:anti-anti-sigma factor
MISKSQVSPLSYPLSGEIDIAVAAEVERELTSAAGTGAAPGVELDCAALTFIDASGITMLLNVAARSGKPVRLVNVAPACRRVFEVLNLCERFGLAPRPPLHLVPSPTT